MTVTDDQTLERSIELYDLLKRRGLSVKPTKMEGGHCLYLWLACFSDWPGKPQPTPAEKATKILHDFEQKDWATVEPGKRQTLLAIIGTIIGNHQTAKALRA